MEDDSFLLKLFTKEAMQYMKKFVQEHPNTEYIWDFLINELHDKINLDIVIFAINELYKDNEFSKSLYKLFDCRDIIDRDILLNIYEDVLTSNFIRIKMPGTYEKLFL